MTDNTRNLARLNDLDLVTIYPDGLPLPELERLAEVGHVVEMRSYIRLVKKSAQEKKDLETDLRAHRLSFEAIFQNNKILADSDRPNALLFKALRTLEGQVQKFYRDLEKHMLDLHDVESSGGCIYDFCWSILNDLQCTIENMEDTHFLDVLEGFERLDI